MLDLCECTANKCKHNLPLCILLCNLSYAVFLIYGLLIVSYVICSSLILNGTLTFELLFF